MGLEQLADCKKCAVVFFTLSEKGNTSLQVHVEEWKRDRQSEQKDNVSVPWVGSKSKKHLANTNLNNWLHLMNSRLFSAYLRLSELWRWTVQGQWEWEHLDSNTAGCARKLTCEALSAHGSSGKKQQKNGLVCVTARQTKTLLPWGKEQSQHLEQVDGNKREEGLCVLKVVTFHFTPRSVSALHSSLIDCHCHDFLLP